jgi:nicotinamidase-related amidase
VGLDAAECINATVEASQNRNYKVNLIEEAILSKSTEMKDSMIAVFKDRSVKVLHIDSLKVLE